MPSDSPLVQLGQWLRQTGYRFVTVTPATHLRVNARADSREARSTADVFGWSRPFHSALLPGVVVDLLHRANALERRGDLLISHVRFSTLNGQLFVHSAFPTLAPDAVFFGPDTYRFAALIDTTLAKLGNPSFQCIVDVGCGSGAGGIVAALASGASSKLDLTDINATALYYSEVNAELAGLAATMHQGDLFSGLSQPADLIVANPPYLVDPEARLYRNGGGTLGSALSMRIVREGIAALAPGGTLILYTATPIVRGSDLLQQEIVTATRAAAVCYTYTEIDPDVFGEELESPAYREVDRIAVVGLVLRSLALPTLAASSCAQPASTSPASDR